MQKKTEPTQDEDNEDEGTGLKYERKPYYKIFKDIDENEDSYARYYPMVRIRLTSENLDYLTKAIVLNDELYEFCKEHMEELGRGQ